MVFDTTRKWWLVQIKERLSGCWEYDWRTAVDAVVYGAVARLQVYDSLQLASAAASRYTNKSHIASPLEVNADEIRKSLKGGREVMEIVPEAGEPFTVDPADIWPNP